MDGFGLPGFLGKETLQATWQCHSCGTRCLGPSSCSSSGQREMGGKGRESGWFQVSHVFTFIFVVIWWFQRFFWSIVISGSTLIRTKVQKSLESTELIVLQFLCQKHVKLMESGDFSHYQPHSLDKDVAKLWLKALHPIGETTCGHRFDDHGNRPERGWTNLTIQNKKGGWQNPSKKCEMQGSEEPAQNRRIGKSSTKYCAQTCRCKMLQTLYNRFLIPTACYALGISSSCKRPISAGLGRPKGSRGRQGSAEFPGVVTPETGSHDFSLLWGETG